MIGEVGGLMLGNVVLNMELWCVDCGEFGIEDVNFEGGLENLVKLLFLMDDESKGGVVGEWLRCYWLLLVGVDVCESMGGVNILGVSFSFFFFGLWIFCFGVMW